VVLLNLDAGEHGDEPDELWALADVLCVACGGHAGDTASMTRAVQFCAERQRSGLPGPRIGAHPSYADRANFGRISRAPTTREARRALFDDLVAQCTSLRLIASHYGVHVEYVKPHGALYHDVDFNADLALTFVLAARQALDVASLPRRRLGFIGPANGALQISADAQGEYLREGFADRRARPDGTLVPRNEPGAVITDPAAAAARVNELVADFACDTICCHADTPGSYAIVSAVRTAINSAG
jgi:UPF0271 protein